MALANPIPGLVLACLCLSIQVFSALVLLKRVNSKTMNVIPLALSFLVSSVGISFAVLAETMDYKIFSVTAAVLIPLQYLLLLPFVKSRFYGGIKTPHSFLSFLVITCVILYICSQILRFLPGIAFVGLFAYEFSTISQLSIITITQGWLAYSAIMAGKSIGHQVGLELWIRNRY